MNNNSMNNNSISALYIHIPFCSRICSYCDFYKMVAKEDLKEKYINYLLKEIDLKKAYMEDLKTIYIGGGTPSIIRLDLLEKLFYKLKSVINMEQIIEFTFECNPVNVNEDLAKLLKQNGINRISLGVQSLNKKKLDFLNRDHSKKDVVKAIKCLHKNKIYNINADIMYAVGNEDFRKIKKEIHILADLGVTHFSTYSLILEEKTILYQKYRNNLFIPMDEDKESQMYYHIVNELDKLGYKQYEISNFAKNGFESIHNLTYWNNLHYLGIGAGSSYYIDDVRYTNVKNLQKYFDGIDNNKLEYSEKINLSIEEQIKEELMLGLRKTKGINVVEFKTKFNRDIFEFFPVINDLIKDNILEFRDNFLFVNAKKMYILNEILVKFF